MDSKCSGTLVDWVERVFFELGFRGLGFFARSAPSEGLQKAATFEVFLGFEALPGDKDRDLIGWDIAGDTISILRIELNHEHVLFHVTPETFFTVHRLSIVARI